MPFIKRDGTIDLEHLRELLRRDTVLVSVCAVDSELGTVQLENLEQRTARVRALNHHLRTEFAKYSAVRFNSPENAVPHILNLSINGVKGTVFQRRLGEYGVCVSVKSACSAEETPSKAVYAVSRDRKTAPSATMAGAARSGRRSRRSCAD